MTATTPAATDQTPTQGYRNLVLLLLLIVYTFNFLDRQIIGILKDPIQAELGLTDTQLGLMGGVAFAFLYCTLGIPIAWLADRISRTWIITASLTVWSGFTAACGMANSFWSLFAMRMGVGIGEAGGVAPSYSMISDYFPPKQRARALAVFSFGIPVGMALGILFGGIIAARVDWRVAFIAVGVAGVVLAPIFRLLVRDPKRGGFDAPAPSAAPAADEDPIPGADGARGAETVPAAPAAYAPPSFMTACRTILPKPTFWLLALGAACSSVCGYGVAYWLPTFFQRSLGLTLEETAWYYSAITLFGGMAGIWLGGWLADRFGGGRRSVYPLVPAFAFIVALPFFYLSLNAPNLALAFPLFLIPTALNLAWLGPVVTAIQHIAPATMRSQASAMFLLVNNLVGIALGMYYFGFVSDLLQPTFGSESIRWAIYSGGVFYVLAVILLICASRTIKKDWVD